MSTVPLWNLIGNHFTAVIDTDKIYSCAELVALAPKIHELLHVSQAYITHFAPLITPSTSGEVKTYRALMKAVIDCRHSVGASLIVLRCRIAKTEAAAAAAGNGTGDPVLATAAYLDLLRSSELANFALMHIGGLTVHLHNNFFSQQLQKRQQQQQGKKQAKQKQRGPKGSAAVCASSSSSSSNASSSATPQIPASFLDLQLQPDHQSFTRVPGGEKTIAAHAAFYQDHLALLGTKACPDGAALGHCLQVSTTMPAMVLDQHFIALRFPPAASPQLRAQQQQVLSPGDPQLLSSPGASAAVMKLLLDALVVGGKLGDLALVLLVIRH